MNKNNQQLFLFFIMIQILLKPSSCW